eukprot:1987821-Rhodomonas_salina.1
MSEYRACSRHIEAAEGRNTVHVPRAAAAQVLRHGRGHVVAIEVAGQVVAHARGAASELETHPCKEAGARPHCRGEGQRCRPHVQVARTSIGVGVSSASTHREWSDRALVKWYVAFETHKFGRTTDALGRAHLLRERARGAVDTGVGPDYGLELARRTRCALRLVACCTHESESAIANALHTPG